MASSPHTTPAPDEGKTVVSRMILDMEDDISEMYGVVLTVLESVCSRGGDAGAPRDLKAAHHTLPDLRERLEAISEWHGKLFHATHDWPAPAESAEAGPAKPAEKAPTPTPKAGPTIRDLCHEWDIVAAKLALEVLERGHGQETCDFLCEPAEARWREIESAILETEPDTIRDVDLVVTLRLARKIISNDEYATSEDAAVAMLDLIEDTLVRRTEPADWHREVQS